eukprot:sb/3466831/
MYFDPVKCVALALGTTGFVINSILIGLNFASPSLPSVKHELLILYRHIVTVDVLSCFLPVVLFFLNTHISELGSVAFLLGVAQFFLSSVLTITSLGVFSASSVFRKINFIVSTCVGIWLLSTVAGIVSLIIKNILDSLVLCEILRKGYFIVHVFAGSVCSVAGLVRICLLLSWIVRLVQLSPSWIHYSRPLLGVLVETVVSFLANLAALLCGILFMMPHDGDGGTGREFHLSLFVMSVCGVSCVNGVVILLQPYYKERVKKVCGINSYEPIVSSYFVIRSGGILDFSIDDTTQNESTEAPLLLRRDHSHGAVSTMRTLDGL